MDVSQRRLAEFHSTLKAEHSGVDIMPLKCNVADEGDVANMVKDTVGAFGRIDYAVNAAGLAHVAKFAEFKTADVSCYKIKLTSVG